MDTCPIQFSMCVAIFLLSALIHAGSDNWATLCNTVCSMLSDRCPVCLCLSVLSTPFPSNRHHRSSGDCLEGKRENYQVCSVQYCVQQLYTVNCTHIWTEPTVLWIGFCLTGPIPLCLDSFLCMCCFESDCTLHVCVTRWGGPGGIEAWSLGLLLPSVLWNCW